MEVTSQCTTHIASTLQRMELICHAVLPHPGSEAAVPKETEDAPLRTGRAGGLTGMEVTSQCKTHVASTLRRMPFVGYAVLPHPGSDGAVPKETDDAGMEDAAENR